MNRKLIALLSVLLVVTLSIFAYQIYEKHSSVLKHREIIKSLDSLSYKLSFETKDLKEYLIVLYFNSECEFCRSQIEELSKNISSLPSATLILISHEPQDQAISFLRDLNLESFYLPVDPKKLINLFPSATPQTYIFYRKNLIHHFEGEIKFSLLTKALSEQEGK